MTVSRESGPPLAPPPRLGAFVRRNPIALKELRGRMRGPRAFIVLTAYAALMSLFVVILYLIYTASMAITSSAGGGVIGKLIFGGVFATELFMVCFIAPAFTTGAISGERERRTFNLLRSTLLSARRVVFGKLISALAYIVLLLMVAIPLQSLAFLMGGITPAEVLLAVELLLVTAAGYSTLGLFLSAATRRTLSATILTYTIVLLVTVALPFVALMMMGLLMTLNVTVPSRPEVEAPLLYLFGLLISTSPVATAIVTEVVLQQKGTAFFFTETISNGVNIPLVSPWIVYTILLLVMTVVLLLWTVRLVRRMEADSS